MRITSNQRIRENFAHIRTLAMAFLLLLCLLAGALCPVLAMEDDAAPAASGETTPTETSEAGTAEEASPEDAMPSPSPAGNTSEEWTSSDESSQDFSIQSNTTNDTGPFDNGTLPLDNGSAPLDNGTLSNASNEETPWDGDASVNGTNESIDLVEGMPENSSNETAEDALASGTIRTAGPLSVMSLRLLGTPRGSLYAAVDGIPGETSAPVYFGLVDDAAEQYERPGYEFLGLFVGGSRVAGLYQDATTQALYVSFDRTDALGVLVEAEDLVLRYREERQTGRVTVTVVNESGAAGDTRQVRFTGGLSYVLGEAYGFSLREYPGYPILEVNVITETSTQLLYQGDSLGEQAFYLVPEEDALEIRVRVRDAERFSLNLRGPNVSYVYDGHTYLCYDPAVAPNVDAVNLFFQYEPVHEMVIGLISNDGPTAVPFTLNKVTLIMEGTGFPVTVPEAVGESRVSSLGEYGTVKLTKTRGIGETSDSTAYEMVLTAPEGRDLRGDIAVDANFKALHISEVWVKQLEGAMPIGYYGVFYRREGYRLVVEDVDTTDSQWMLMVPTAIAFHVRNWARETPSVYFFGPLPGYLPEELQVEVRFYDKQENYEVFMDTPMSQMLPISQLPGYVPADARQKIAEKGFKYFFEIPGDTEELVIDDVRIYVRDRSDRDYRIVYDLDGGEMEGMAESQVIRRGSYAAVTTSIPVRAGYVFGGWRLGEELFSPGQLMELTAQRCGSAVRNDTEPVMDLTLKAQWTPMAQAQEGPFQVLVYFEKPGQGYADGRGGISDSPDLILPDKRGILGRRIYIDRAKLESENAGSYPAGWQDLYVFDRMENSEVIRADGSTRVRIYYARRVPVPTGIGQNRAALGGLGILMLLLMGALPALRRRIRRWA